MPELEQLVGALSNLTVVEAGKLAKMLEEKWGVSASPAVISQQAQPVEEAAPVEEQTEFTVVLAAIDAAKKINVIKEVRAVRPDLGLKEAKDLVEGAPQALKEGVSKLDAEALKAKLEAAGATIQVK